MTEKEKKDFFKNLNGGLTDTELLSIVDGAFEKVVQSSIQPLSLVPNSSWDKWPEFVLKHRLNEKFQKILMNVLTLNTSSFMVLPSDEDGQKVDVVVPVSTGQLTASRGGTTLIKSAHVVAEQENLLYEASAGSALYSYMKKGGNIIKSIGNISSQANGVYEYKNAFISTEGFEGTKLKYIPVVWFTKSWITLQQKQMLSANKKLAVKILKELVAQLELAGPNLILVGSANNTTTQATATKKAVLKKGSRVNVINESLNKTVQNPIISFNNQPWFKEFWELIESMVNTVIEGLQVGDLNQGGKGTANMHDTEVATSFGVKAQKIINTQNMFLSSWDLLGKILKDNGVNIPAKVTFTYDQEDNILINQIRQAQQEQVDTKMGQGDNPEAPKEEK